MSAAPSPALSDLRLFLETFFFFFFERSKASSSTGETDDS